MGVIVATIHSLDSANDEASRREVFDGTPEVYL